MERRRAGIFFAGASLLTVVIVCNLEHVLNYVNKAQRHLETNLVSYMLILCIE
jgi:hypothetical protein